MQKTRISPDMVVYRLQKQDSTLGECLIRELNKHTKGASYVRSHQNEHFIDVTIVTGPNQDSDELLQLALTELVKTFLQLKKSLS
jgi:DNA-directed RNA polymerase subunit L